jgi:glycolate oxidase
MEFEKINEAFVKDLRKIVDERGVIFEDRESLESYASDESGGEYYAHMPDAVIKPENAAQISKIVKLANSAHIPITPRGAGSGLAGAAVPIYGGIVLSMERMNKIKEIDSQNLAAVAEPGVVTNDLCKKAAEENLYYAGYPMSVETSFIGGNVATNAGGSKVVKYGNTGHHILGIEAVLPDGEIVRFGGKRRKDSSGYEFVKFLVGSEGTLAVFTEITVNLIPLPGKTVDMLVPFKSVEDAIKNVSIAIREGKVLPSAVEFIDKLSVEIGTVYNNTKLPHQEDAAAYLIIQFEGKNRAELEAIYEKTGKALIANGAIDVFIADNRSASERIWKVRRNWLEAIKAVDPFVPTGDVVVPTGEIPRITAFIDEISKEYGVKIPVAAHAADGNLHPCPMKPREIPLSEWKALSEEILDKIALKAASLGGAVSGEHGIGFLKKEILQKTKPKQVALMKQIKKILDPNNIMNPGKLFDLA